MYENTTPEAHRMAAELIEAGVEPHEVYRRLYEDLPFRRLQLLQRALSSVERHDGGAITIAHLVKDDYEQTGAQENDSEGVVDHMRAVEGTAVAVLVRELLSDDRDGMRKVSLRATDGRVDVSRIAREFGGGGHPQAAGFSTPLPYPELVEKLRGHVREQLADSALAELTAAGVLLRAKPAGSDLPRRGRRGAPRAAARHEGRPRRARSTRSPPGCCSCWSGRATRAQRFLMGLPKTYRAVARLGWTSDTGDRDGELAQTGPRARAARDPGRRAAAAPARLLRRQGRRRARLRAGAPRRGGRDASRGRSPSTAPSCSGTRAIGPRSRSSARRAPTSAR